MITRKQLLKANETLCRDAKRKADIIDAWQREASALKAVNEVLNHENKALHELLRVLAHAYMGGDGPTSEEWDHIMQILWPDLEDDNEQESAPPQAGESTSPTYDEIPF